MSAPSYSPARMMWLQLAFLKRTGPWAWIGRYAGVEE
jgi:hypothetical protein